MFKSLDFYLNRLVMRDGIRYSFEHTDLRFRQFLDDEFFKHTAWCRATPLGQYTDYIIDSATVLAISAVDVASDIAGRQG